MTRSFNFSFTTDPLSNEVFCVGKSRDRKREMTAIQPFKCMMPITFKKMKYRNLCKTATLKKTHNWFSRPIKKHSAILLTFIRLPFVIQIVVLSFFEWPFYTGFTVHPF